MCEPTFLEALHDVGVQRRLWAVSEELTGVVYPVD